MVCRAKELIKVMERLAPPGLAEEWDNSGWQVGNPEASVDKVLICLDLTAEVVDEALAEGAQMVICHHPLLLKGINSIRLDLQPGSLIYNVIRSGISVYASHTSYDSAPGGVNDVLADLLGLQRVTPLLPKNYERLLKLVVFVPAGTADAVRQVLGEAGAGWIGKYSHCSFNLQGNGTFLPRQNTTPFIGTEGRLEHVEEVRIETVVKEEEVDRVIKAMLEVHPYEEVAYDLYPLKNQVKIGGLGRIGMLPQVVSLAELVETVKQVLGITNVRLGGEQGEMVQKVAVCGGSGGDLWSAARGKGAEVLVTGDVRYHAARDMMANGMNFIDAGHFATERVALPSLKEKLEGLVAKAGLSLKVMVSKVERDAWAHL